jgi:hypothetical protein
MHDRRARVAPGRVAAAGALLVLGIASVGMAGAIDPTDPSVPEAALLQQADIPLPVTSQGVNTFVPEDLPEFGANGGLLEVSQTWYSLDPIVLVFDFRFQFPDAASAGAFLDVAEETLGEVATGATREQPPVTPLPDTRYYVFEDKVTGSGAIGFNYLMGHENLVAKVYVSGAGDSISADQAASVAEAAAARMVEALGGEPVPGPSASPGPSAVPGPSGDPAALGELLGHVPSALRDACVDRPFAEAFPPAGARARATCSQVDGAEVEYVLFDAPESLDAAYDALREHARLFGTVTFATTCQEGAYDGTWTLGGEEAGRLLCYQESGLARIAWSHPDTLILSTIAVPDRDHAAAWDLWLAAGPE